MFHGAELLQIQQLTFEQPEEIFYHSIVQTVSLAAHALSDPLLAKHPLVLLVLILPTLIRVENQAEKEKVLKRLLATTDYKEFRMNYSVEPELLGGMIIRINDRVVDSSIKTKLDKLAGDLKKIQLS